MQNTNKTCIHRGPQLDNVIVHDHDHYEEGPTTRLLSKLAAYSIDPVLELVGLPAFSKDIFCCLDLLQIENKSSVHITLM